MRLLVVGAGSTGGYFGARLAAAGRDVTFLVRPRRAARLQNDGLQIVSPHGDLKINPKLVVTGKIPAHFDVILLAVKAYSLDSALNDVAPAVGPETMILPVLNGMKHVEIIRERFGESSLVGCVCKIASYLDDADRIVQLADMQSLDYGEMDGSKSARTDQLNAFMQGSGFDAKLTQSIERKMWEKWVMMATIGGINCLMRGSIGEVEAAPDGTRFALQLLGEAIATVIAAGHPPSERFVESIRQTVTTKHSALTSSMYRDLQSGNRVEADQIVGDFVARAREAGVATPLLSAAYTNLCIYQSRIGKQMSGKNVEARPA